jgi:transglutaminase-like putative cysteine protease
MNFSSATSVNQTVNNINNISATTSTSHINTTKYHAAGTPTSTKKLVCGLTLAQIKDGLSRTQKFYNTNKRLPNYVNFGTRKIPIASFQKILASQNLKIITKPTSPINPNTSSISALAKSLTTGTSSEQTKATRIYNWVRDHISYSFYYNTRYGASGTLKNRTGNCVDTSHLLIALVRAAGLTAVYKHGNCKFSSGSTYGHVWTNIKVDGKWYAADATSSRNSFGVIKNWNTGNYILKGTYTKLPF